MSDSHFFGSPWEPHCLQRLKRIDFLKISHGKPGTTAKIMILYQARINGGITMTRNNVNYVYNPFNKVGKRFLEVFSSFSLVKHVGNITHSCLR